MKFIPIIVAILSLANVAQAGSLNCDPSIANASDLNFILESYGAPVAKLIATGLTIKGAPTREADVKVSLKINPDHVSGKAGDFVQAQIFISQITTEAGEDLYVLSPHGFFDVNVKGLPIFVDNGERCQYSILAPTPILNLLIIVNKKGAPILGGNISCFLRDIAAPYPKN